MRYPYAMTGTLGPAVAGTWYPSDPRALATQVDGFLDEAASASDDRAASVPAVLIAPHAGFVYSGAVAARGFVRLRGRRFERVVLLGPSHYSAFSGAAMPAASSYRTPLGEVGIDTESAAELAALPELRIDDGPFRPEHSLEAEIPFLQRALAPGWRLLPLLIGAGSPAPSNEAVARALRPLLGPQSLVVVSSDFTHYGPRFDYVPFSEDVPGRIETLDKGAVDRILAWNAGEFESYVSRTGATICGRHAIDVLLRLPQEGFAGELADYDTSGRITGSWDHSVSYASLIFARPEADAQ